MKVSTSGLGEDAYSDPACSRRIDDPYLDSIVKCIRFEPALRDGKAVDETLPVPSPEALLHAETSGPTDS